VLCLGHRLAKNETTRYARNLGVAIAPIAPLATPMCVVLSTLLDRFPVGAANRTCLAENYLTKLLPRGKELRHKNVVSSENKEENKVVLVPHNGLVPHNATLARHLNVVNVSARAQSFAWNFWREKY